LEKISMKKTLIALATVAVTSTAMAQVTLSGKMGVGVSDSTDQAKSIGWTDGAVTFATSEDLGGGMKLSASSTLAFKSQSTAALSDGNSIALTGGFGSIDFVSTSADADALGVGSLPYSTADVMGGTTSNYTMSNYTLPAMVPGLTVAVRFNNGNAGAVATTDTNEQLRVTYQIGDATIFLASKTNQSEVKLTYKVAGATLNYFARTKEAAGTDKRKEYSISAPVGPVTLAMSRATRGAFLSGTEYNASYALSKRTVLNYSYGKFSTTAAATGDKTASRLKLVHSF